jgi:predicted transcriptional regulator of viral defense system
MSRSVDATIAALAGSQWGLITAAQATAGGVARSTLLRREQAGALERMRAGVYRLPGAPASRLDDLRAAWLSSAPAVPAWERAAEPDVVVGGAAAAWAHDIGDLYPSPVLLYTRTRRQSKHEDVRYSSRFLPSEDVTLLDGLPVTTRERTIADLLNEPGSDMSLVADALRDAERADADLDTARLATLLDATAKRLGHASGVALYEHLRSMTRVDAERLRNLLAHTDLPDLVGALADDRVRAVLGSLHDAVTDEHTRAVIASLRGPALAERNAWVKDVIVPAEALRISQAVVPRVQLPPEMRAMLTQIAAAQAPVLAPEVRKRISELVQKPAVHLPAVGGAPRPAIADEESDG